MAEEDEEVVVCPVIMNDRGSDPGNCSVGGNGGGGVGPKHR